jgi:hypothetical protein
MRIAGKTKSTTAKMSNDTIDGDAFTLKTVAETAAAITSIHFIQISEELKLLQPSTEIKLSS